MNYFFRPNFTQSSVDNVCAQEAREQKAGSKLDVKEQKVGSELDVKEQKVADSPLLIIAWLLR